MKNKRGISAVVATVLIILITVAAVAIIWAAIIPMLSSQIGKSNACITAQSQLEIVDACANKGNNIPPPNHIDPVLNITIKRGTGDFDLKDIALTIYKGGNSKTYKISNLSTKEIPNSGEQKKYVINGADIVSITGDQYDVIGNIDKVAIAAIVVTDNKETTCTTTPTFKVSKC